MSYLQHYLSALICALLTLPHALNAQFLEGYQVGEILGVDIKEGSGMVASLQHPGVLWAHEDRGSPGEIVRLHAMGTFGDYLGQYILQDVENQDMEDMAYGPGPEPGQWYVYLGDIGNNWKKIPSRRGVRIYRVKEPDPPCCGDAIDLDGVDTLTLLWPVYDEDKYIDSEAMFVDPLLGEIYILRKQSGDVVEIYATPPGTIQREGSFTLTMEERGEIDGIGTITGADISRTGRELLLKRWEEVYYFTRQADTPVAESLINKEGFAILPYQQELQGEAIAFAYDMSGYYTYSEAQKEESIPLFFYARDGPSPPIPPMATPALRETASPSPSPMTPAPTAWPTTNTPITDAPVDSTPNPTLVPTLPSNQIVDFCNDEECTEPLKLCQGDCDRDGDCEEGLICFYRDNDDDPVPGCIGGEDMGDETDICIMDQDRVTTAFTPEPTIEPTTLPPTTVAPTTANPTVNPTTANPLQVVFLCDEEECTEPLQKCQGDCDSDSDCAEGLICYDRDDGFEPVPGCIGGEQMEEETDICIVDLAAITNTAASVASTDPPVVFICNNDDCDEPLQECQSDCDEDTDCAGDLICFQRDGDFDPVPGCTGGESFGDDADFCIVNVTAVEISLGNSTDTFANGTIANTTTTPTTATANTFPTFGSVNITVEKTVDDMEP